MEGGRGVVEEEEEEEEGGRDGERGNKKIKIAALP